MRRLAVILVVAAGLTLLVRGLVPCVAWQLQPACYVALHPGPTENTFSLVTVQGERAYRPSGELLLTTVAVESDLDLLEWVKGGFQPGVDQVPRDRVFPPGRDREEVREQNVALMVDSQLDATIAALRHLGYEFDTDFDGAEVVEVHDGSPVAEQLEPGDVVVAIDGVDVADNRALVETVQQRRPGDRLTLTVERDEERFEVAGELAASPDDPERPLLGVTVRSHLELPVDVGIDAGIIGGPSAGLVFALSLVELLEETDLLGGTVVAATGTIDRDGVVGAIGGIRQKVQAVVAPPGDTPPAAVFLVPRGNLEEAASAPIEEELLLVPIDTLEDALTALAELREGRRPVDALALPRS